MSYYLTDCFKIAREERQPVYVYQTDRYASLMHQRQGTVETVNEWLQARGEPICAASWGM